MSISCIILIEQQITSHKKYLSYARTYILLLRNKHHLYAAYKRKYRIAGKFGKFTVMSVWRGKVWRMDRFSHKVILISKNLDGFSLANHGRFTKFTKLFPRQSFPLYGSTNKIFTHLRILKLHIQCEQHMKRMNFILVYWNIQ